MVVVLLRHCLTHLTLETKLCVFSSQSVFFFAAAAVFGKLHADHCWSKSDQKVHHLSIMLSSVM